MFKKLFVVLFSLMAMLFGFSAHALPPTTVAELTSGISLGDVSLGILAIAALMAAIYVTWRSAKFVINALRTM